MTTATSVTNIVTTGADLDRKIVELRGRLAGEILTAGAATYDEARKVANVTVNRHPRVIIRAASDQDVVEAVRFARSSGLPVAVRSGGHSVATHSMADGAVVIDLSQMKGVLIDPERRTARVQPGGTSADLAGPAHAYGLALSTGDTSSVGIAGLTTGGGIGWMVRKFGLAIDNLLSAKVVTADGSLLRVAADENADLFWAIRGGGGNFGIVVEFEFQLAQVGQVLAGAILLPATRDVIRGVLEIATDAPDELTIIAAIMHAPPAPFVPENRIGELTFFVMPVWAGDVDEGQPVIDRLRALGPAMADTVEPIPYPVMFNYMAEAAKPHGVGIRSMFADEFSDAEIDAMIAAMDRATSPMSMVQLRGLGGAMGRVDVEDTAFAHRDRKYMVAILALWQDPAEDSDPHHAWTQALWEEIRGAAKGVYVNFVSNEGDDRVRDAYPPRTFARLTAAKKKYDPENLFKLNQNIRPE